MKGLALRSLTWELRRVPAHRARNPVLTIAEPEARLVPYRAEIDEDFCENFLFLKDYHRLPYRMLRGFSLDELCKLRYSSRIMMHQSVQQLFETRVPHDVIRKIELSMWRWGYSRGTWNQIVDAYEHLRKFSFPISDFQVRLDYATWNNEYGYSKYARTYLDGAFGFLLCYRGEHVMTIGFSIAAGRRILIQQVQSVKARGNRHLYRLPGNRLEFIIELFRDNFPGYQLLVIDGNHLIERILKGYRQSFLRCRETEDLARQAALQAQIVHLESDHERLGAFYRNTGRFTLGAIPQIISGTPHYPIRMSGVT